MLKPMAVLFVVILLAVLFMPIAWFGEQSRLEFFLSSVLTPFVCAIIGGIIVSVLFRK